MQVTVSHLTELTVLDLKAFDLDAEFGLACLQVEGDEVAIYLNNGLLRSWRHVGYEKPVEIKWFSREEVVAYPPVAIVSETGPRELEKSWPYKFILSDHFIFIAYNDEVIYGCRDDDVEANATSIYSKEGNFELSFSDFFNKDRSANFVEIEACYSFGDTFVFTADDLDKLWIFNAAARTYRSILAPFDLVAIHVMTGDDKKSYAIFDNRYRSQSIPICRHSNSLSSTSSRGRRSSKASHRSRQP
jgi:hypothetical protein